MGTELRSRYCQIGVAHGQVLPKSQPCRHLHGVQVALDRVGFIPGLLALLWPIVLDYPMIAVVVEPFGPDSFSGKINLAGDGAEDWQITGDLTAELRAVRSGPGSDRVHTIAISAPTRPTTRARIPLP